MIYSDRPITISVIGHTNTGKTSLLRTLLRDEYFGEVKNASATTRHVACVQILDRQGNPLVNLHDTPGLEDASGVMDFLQDHTDGRLDGLERLQQFLVACQNKDERLLADFSQEAKVINSLLQADIALYVIDAREPILSKYKDELAILASSGTPILPVFNFIQDRQDNMVQWRQMLARRALHITNAFDTVAFDFRAEMALWKNLENLSGGQSNLQLIQTQRQEDWQNLAEQGSNMIADFLVNVASFSQKIAEDEDQAPALSLVQNAVRQAEGILHDRLLQLYQFYQVDIQKESLNIQSFRQDIFDSELLTRYGIRTAGGSVTGMILGAGIDMATLGASLGLGTALGGVLGGILPNTNTIKDKALGLKTLLVDDPTLNLLAARAQNLHHHLRHRGHASLQEILTQPKALPWQSLPSALKKSRASPHYCSLLGSYDDKQNLREDLAGQLSYQLEAHLHSLEQVS